jgi:hypothetical protein
LPSSRRRITKDLYNNKLSQLISCQQEINQLLEQHYKGNKKLKISLSSLITVASRAYDPFKSSTTNEKRDLLGYTFSNLESEGRKLRFCLRKHFNLFGDLANCQ